MIDIEKIAWLAKIKLSEDEKKELLNDIYNILDLFKKIQQVEIIVENFECKECFDKNFREEKNTEVFDSGEIIKKFSKKRRKFIRSS